MAISPQDAKKHLNAKEQADLTRLEKRLDEALVAFDGSPVTIDATILACTKKVIDKLLEKYRSAGWTIRLQGDQRDGNYYEFKENTRSSYSNPWD